MCDDLAARYEEVRVIHEGSRNGFGAAVRLGYQHASMDLVWLVTVDLPFPLEALLTALPLLDQFECVLSYRVGDRRNGFRRVQGWAFNQLAKRLLGLRVRHVNSAFKIFRRSVVQRLKLGSSGWLLDAEIVYRLQEGNVTWTEIPVELCDRASGGSSTGFLTWWGVLVELWEFRKRQMR